MSSIEEDFRKSLKYIYDDLLEAENKQEKDPSGFKNRLQVIHETLQDQEMRICAHFGLGDFGVLSDFEPEYLRRGDAGMDQMIKSQIKLLAVEIGVDLEQNTTITEIQSQIYRLRTFYSLLREYLYLHFGTGYIIHTSESNNRIYLELCFKIEDIINRPELIELSKNSWKPFDNILDVDIDAPDVDWDYGGHQLCDNFMSKIDELYIKNGKKNCPIPLTDLEYIKKIQDFLSNYKEYKKAYDKKWEAKVEKAAEKFNLKHSINIEIPEVSANSQYLPVVNEFKESMSALNIGNTKQSIVSAGTAIHSMLQIFLNENKSTFEKCIELLKKSSEKKKHVTDLHYIRKKRNDYGHPNMNKPEPEEAKIIIEMSVKIFKDFIQN